MSTPKRVAQSFAADFLGRMGFVELDDGRFLAVAKGLMGFVSSDGGRTWGNRHDLTTQTGSTLISTQNGSVIRLASGRIAIQYGRLEKVGTQTTTLLFCATSDDEGGTWSREHRINHTGDGWPWFDVMIQTRSGRLILPVRSTYAGRRIEKDEGEAKGTVKGHPVKVEGHAHFPEIDIAYIYYSDDEGRTWGRSENEVLGWPDNGRIGAYATDEPSVAQTGDGRLLMFARSTLGRIIESWSDDDGVSWSRGLPNGLCNSYSPARLRRIPTTGDLQCVWNQVTPDEILAGYRRSRLSSAISADGGQTWQHFKTLDCADPLDKTPRQEPDPRIRFVVAAQDCGELPANYCMYRYPNVRFIGEMVYISYDRESFVRPGNPRYRNVLRAMPIEQLYDDRQPDISLPNDAPESTPPGAAGDIES